MSKIYNYLNSILHKNGISKPFQQAVVIEKPVTLYVNGVNWLTFMCTPKNLKELAVGFLFNESIIQSKNEVSIVDVGKKEHNVDIWLNKNTEVPKNWRRTSGCAGGYTTAVLSEISPVTKRELSVSPKQIQELFGIFLNKLNVYKEVGGIHSSGISDGKNIIEISVDIGRHNTLDKISGKIILKELNISPIIMFTSGRVSSDMIQKAARINTTLVISRTSPTTLSIEIAKSLGIGLIGYARGKRFTIYTSPDNIHFNDFPK